MVPGLNRKYFVRGIHESPLAHLYGITTGKRKECRQHLPNLVYLGGLGGRAVTKEGWGFFFMNIFFLHGRKRDKIKHITLRVKSEVAQSCLTLQPHGLYPTRLPCPRDFPGKSTGVGCHFLLQGIFLTQELNPGLRLYHLSHQGSRKG